MHPVVRRGFGRSLIFGAAAALAVIGMSGPGAALEPLVAGPAADARLPRVPSDFAVGDLTIEIDMDAPRRMGLNASLKLATPPIPNADLVVGGGWAPASGDRDLALGLRGRHWSVSTRTPMAQWTPDWAIRMSTSSGVSGGLTAGAGRLDARLSIQRRF